MLSVLCGVPQGAIEAGDRFCLASELPLRVSDLRCERSRVQLDVSKKSRKGLLDDATIVVNSAAALTREVMWLDRDFASVGMLLNAAKCISAKKFHAANHCPFTDDSFHDLLYDIIGGLGGAAIRQQLLEALDVDLGARVLFHPDVGFTEVLDLPSMCCHKVAEFAILGLLDRGAAREMARTSQVGHGP